MAQQLKNSSTNAGESRVVGLSPGSGRSPRRKGYIAPIFFPGKFHGEMSHGVAVGHD